MVKNFMTPITTQNNSEKICPYLGIINDDRTAMAYPTYQNFCHKCVPPNIPSISHQREYCLAAKHSDCPLFLSENIQPMPPELLSSKASNSGWTGKRAIWIALLILVLLLAAFFLLTRPGWKAAIFFSSAKVTPTVESDSGVVTLTEGQPTATLLPTVTATIMPPTMTSTPVQPHVLETPIGIGNKLLVHQVKDAETWISLANTYHTTAEAIKAINYNSGTLWVGSLVVIPVEQTDISAYPQFNIIQVVKESITLNDLAVQYSIDIKILSQYNLLPVTYLFHTGEWVLIPVVQKTP